MCLFLLKRFTSCRLLTGLCTELSNNYTKPCLLIHQSNEWMTPQLQNKSATGCQTNGKLRANMYITKLKIPNVIPPKQRRTLTSCSDVTHRAVEPDVVQSVPFVLAVNSHLCQLLRRPLSVKNHTHLLTLGMQPHCWVQTSRWNRHIHTANLNTEIQNWMQRNNL